MKKLIAIVLAAMLLLNLAACGAKNNTETTPTTVGEETVGSILLADFKANNSGTALAVAERLLENPVIVFMSGAMSIEEGWLTGFGETEITGFKEGAMFGPMIGTIPFVGYIFELDEGADVEAFKTTLQENADLRWNICTQADELIVENEGNKVFFLMCPKAFEDTGANDNGIVEEEPGDIKIPIA